MNLYRSRWSRRYSIARAHGGDASAENRPEGGARVRFELPAPPTDVARS
ncbi:hypothetical protein [Agromyces sp. C10]|nr:hypothetical protein [Agromyces sp. C10]MCK8610049.1 hypothetical protein [Agromyces sp. C10]